MKISFTAAHSPIARQALTDLTKQYGQNNIQDADIIVALGGDGHVLRTLYDVMGSGKPVFAMRRTNSVGFLCNDFITEDLPSRLAKSQSVALHPLRLEAQSVDGKKKEAL